MTSGQMRTKIEMLEAQGNELSRSNQRLLANLKGTLADVIADEARRKANKEKAAKYGESQLSATKRKPADDGLSGQAWVEFYNKYCDPKKLAPASLHETETMRPKRALRSVDGRRHLVVVSAPMNADQKAEHQSRTNERFKGLAKAEVPEWRRLAAKKAWETMRAKREAAAQAAA
jgi:hypothetical protein